MDFNTSRQRALAKRVGPVVKVPHSGSESARVRSVKAQVKEMTNVDLRDDIALAWLRSDALDRDVR